MMTAATEQLLPASDAELLPSLLLSSSGACAYMQRICDLGQTQSGAS